MPTGGFRRTGLLATTALVSCLWGGAAQAQLSPGALPTQGQVVAGQSAISQSGNQMTINQGSQRAAINWGSYNVGSAATVTYNQPNAQAISLNRVVGNDPSQIMGGIRANGQVWLINPNGILFGAGSRVDVAGLVASTQNISDRAFMENTNGRFVFDQAGRADAAVVNRGEITVRDAGIAAFVAPGVQNSGTISASLGRVGLASANTFTLDLYGDRLINIAVNDRVMGNAVDAQGNPVRAGVENSGRILADGGRVEISANVARGVVDNVIRMGGIVQARSATVARNGDIVLDGGDGAVEVTGQIDASGRGAGQRGGQVRVRGERITIAPTVTVDVAGDAGGGSILIGGGLRGAGAEPHAQNVSVAAGAALNADAINTGRGGTVVVWSDGTTAFNGAASARGGAMSGDGGLVETSGHTLSVGTSARIDTQAPHGADGQWLLDPLTLNVANSGGDITPATVVANLNTTDVVLDATNSITITDEIYAYDNPNAHSLTLNTHDFVLNNHIILSQFGGSLFINNTGIFTRGNNAGLYVYNGGTITLHQNNGGSIQDAVDSLFSYDDATIIVGVGEYQSFVVDRPYVKLLGARAGLDATGLTTIDPNTQTVINANLRDQPGIWIQQSGVTVDGFTVTNSLQAGIRVGSAEGDSYIENTRILNNYIRGNGAGIVFHGGVYYYGECEGWCGYDYYPDRFVNTIIDSNRIEQNNVVIPYGEDVSIRPSGGLYGLSAGNHGIVFAGDTENTLISRNLITDNNGHGILIAGSSYGYGLQHTNMAIVVNQIVRPGEVGIQVGGEYFYNNLDDYYYGSGYAGEGGRVSGLLIVQNTIADAFNCTVAGACTTIGFTPDSANTTAGEPYIAAEVGLRGAINFENVLLQPFSLESFGSINGASISGLPSGLAGLIGVGGGQAFSLIGAGVTIPDLVAALNGDRGWNGEVGYWYSQPSVYIGYNLISGRGYGVAIQNTVDLGDTVVYINNNHLSANAKGGLLYNLTSSDYFHYGYGSGSGSGSSYYRSCYNYECESGRVIAAGNWWGDQNQNLDTSGANLGNLGPTFTSDVYDNTGFRADIQGSGALSECPTCYGGYYGGEGAGVVVSSWRLDGNNQVARLNELAVNAQTQYGVPNEYPFPITLVVGGQLTGYLPTNTVRVGDVLQEVGTQNYPVPGGAQVAVEGGSFTIWRGPGGWDPAGRITRGVSTIREPLPLLASLIRTSISGGTDNGIVDVLPGQYWNEGSYFVSSWNGDYGVVLVDKNNLTIQASLFGNLVTPTTPPGLIPGTAGAYSYNPDDFDGTLAGRAFQVNDPNFPTRNGSFASNATANEAVLFGGIVVVPNVVRGLIGAAVASYGTEGGGTPEQILSAFTNAAATNNFTLSGMTIVGGFNISQLSGYFDVGYDSAALTFGLNPNSFSYYDLPTVGVLLASGQNHTIRNNRILSFDAYCNEGCEESASSRTTPQGFGYQGEGSIGVWIAPGDAALNALAGYIVSQVFNPNPTVDITLPAPPATGSNTVIAQNDIVGWNTAGIMVGLPGVIQTGGEGLFPIAPATNVQILRNAIMETCTYGCYYQQPFGTQQIDSFYGGAAIVLGDGVGATIQNNWIRNNEVGVANYSTSGLVVINENSFESNVSLLAAQQDLPAILTVTPLVGANNWFGPGQVPEDFTDVSPAPDRFDHNPLLPGWQIGVGGPTTIITDPTFGRIPADGPFSFLANPFNANQPLGGLGGTGPGLQEIAPAAGGQGTNADQCASQSGEQIANSVLGTFNLLNPAVYQQIIRCQQAAAQ